MVVTSHRERKEHTMIATEAALYGVGSATALLDGASVPPTVCSCGQDMSGSARTNCSRCGCCLS